MKKNHHVIIVEDEETIQLILSAFVKKYFASLGSRCTVKTFSDPMQGLLELSNNGRLYDLIMLDVRLPKLTGDELYSSLELIDPELTKKVMFVTGYSSDLLDRFSDKNLIVLEKPFRFPQFTAKVKQIIQA